MAYAVLQTSLVKPEPERLVRAFTALDRLTSLDAHAMARDAYGILVKGLSVAEAARLVQALYSQDILAEMVEEKDLPSLPPAMRLHRAEVRPDAFVAHDLMGRANAVGWSHVVMLGAGEVLRTEFKHKVEERARLVVVNPLSIGGAGPGVMKVEEAEHKDEEERVYRSTLEVFINVAPGRYHITAERFNFGYLGERLSASRGRNYVEMVRDCLARATGAVLNMGAQALRSEPPSVVRYPSRHAFEEELVWLLWRHFVWPRQRGSR